MKFKLNKKGDAKSMQNKNMLEEMKELVKKLNKHAYDYYVLDTPTISDKEYDVLYDKLVDLEEQIGIILPDSPTQRVGDVITEKFERVTHKVRLYSLNKAQNFTQLEKWFNDIKKVSKNPTFSLSYKFDGLTIVCEYNNGLFVGAYTRGNGLVGEDVTTQVKTISSVPLSIDYKGHLIVQGEGVVTLSNLERYNKTAKEKLKNARNAASGGIRNLDPKITRQRSLDVVFYNVILHEDNSLNSQTEAQEFLKEQGFYVSPYFKVVSTMEEIKQELNFVDEQKTKINFLIDGVVINLNNLNQRESFGHTAKFPRWAIAYKFEAMETSTILKEVLWQVGRTGKITPIAIVEPVVLAGATVQRATLNNIEDINKKGLFAPARVFIRRSNEVIPEILSLAEKLENSKTIIPPSKCPSCGNDLVLKNMNYYCENKGFCKEQVVERLVHFASKEATDLEGLSRQTFYALYDSFKVNNPYKLYELKFEDFLKLEGFKERKAKNAVKSLEKSKKVKLSNFIFALGILNVGTKSARDLAKHFKTFNNFKNSSVEELLEVRDIGDITAQTITDFFKQDENLFMLEKFFEYGFEIEEINKEKGMEKTIFFEKTVVLTGTFENLSRTKATEILESYGAIVTGSVSQKTNFVIFGEAAGSKKAKAEELGVKTIEFSQVFGKILK
jgi:DNA ligase (NAD+)